MNKILLCLALLFAANSLWAFSYYPGNYGRYSYDGEQYQRQSRRAAKPLEQQYDNLIIMFTRDQCPYCEYMKPIMKEVESKYGNVIKFLYVDVAANPQYASQYGFKTVPHIAYFKDGELLHAHGSGDKTMTAEQVEENIKSLGMANNEE